MLPQDDNKAKKSFHLGYQTQIDKTPLNSL